MSALRKVHVFRRGQTQRNLRSSRGRATISRKISKASLRPHRTRRPTSDQEQIHLERGSERFVLYCSRQSMQQSQDSTIPSPGQNSPRVFTTLQHEYRQLQQHALSLRCGRLPSSLALVGCSRDGCQLPQVWIRTD